MYHYDLLFIHLVAIIVINNFRNKFQNVVNEVPKEFIKGIGFDATCSLVILDEFGQPVTASLTGNIINLIFIIVEVKKIFIHKSKIIFIPFKTLIFSINVN